MNFSAALAFLSLFPVFAFDNFELKLLGRGECTLRVQRRLSGTAAITG
jgi:hypothetical protein